MGGARGGGRARRPLVSASAVAARYLRGTYGRDPAPAPPRVRYEWPRPGQLLHRDIKKLGRIGHVGHRITGDRHGQARGIGWEFAHVCIDDCSRVAYAEVLSDETGPTVAAFLRRAVGWFRRRGFACSES